MMNAKRLYSLLLAAIVFMAGWTQVASQTRYTLQAESKLWIEGTSSIHDFTCDATEIDGRFETEAPAEDETGSVGQVSRVDVMVPVEQIDCGKGTMNRKMREALRTDDYPAVQYTQEGLDVLKASEADGWYELKSKGQLTIAGKSQPIEMVVKGKMLEDGRLRFEGQYGLNMTDYDVDPPSAMFGALKTHEDVVVHFEVVAKPSPPEKNAGE